jgi:D-glycero-D-manno-heptose 1,7-bisphosphate phosphatase
MNGHRLRTESRRVAVFLDRDGTLTEPRAYPRTAEDLVLNEGVGPGLRRLQRIGALLIVATNQSGLARGLFDLDALTRMHTHLEAELGRRGVRLDGIYVCPHHPDGAVANLSVRCACRKPEPGMLLRAAAERGIDLSRSWMVGDATTDVVAGHSAGCHTALVAKAPPAPATTGGIRPDVVGPTTAHVLVYIGHRLAAAIGTQWRLG